MPSGRRWTVGLDLEIGRNEALGILRELIERVVTHRTEDALQAKVVVEVLRIVELGLWSMAGPVASLGFDRRRAFGRGPAQSN